MAQTAQTAPADVMPSFFERLFFAWAYFFRLLADPRLAFRTKLLADHGSMPQLEATGDKAAEKVVEKIASVPVEKVVEKIVEVRGEATIDAALALLGVLQKEGRLVDFLEQDITAFSDADVGAAARVVHEGCRKAMKGVVAFEPVHASEEGAAVTVEEAELKSKVKVIGQVSGSPPFSGALRHRGWRVTNIKLPTFTAGMDAHVIAPAEVEL